MHNRKEAEDEGLRGARGVVFSCGETMANTTTQEDKDWERYKTLKRGIKFFNWGTVGGVDEDLREIAVLDAKYPHFEAKWRASPEGKLSPLPLVKFGGKRKRSRRGKTKHRRNATQSHRRVKA